MSAVCEHVPFDAADAVMVSPHREPSQIEVRCPCCNLRAGRDPGDDLTADFCPYRGAQAEWVAEVLT